MSDGGATAGYRTEASQDGERRPPRRGQIYRVFNNEDRVAYNWRWEKADADQPGLPRDYEKRFKRRLL